MRETWRATDLPGYAWVHLYNLYSKDVPDLHTPVVDAPGCGKMVFTNVIPGGTVTRGFGSGTQEHVHMHNSDSLLISALLTRLKPYGQTRHFLGSQ